MSTGVGVLQRHPPSAPLVVASAAVAAVAAIEFAGTDDGVGVCPVRHLTGGYCPGCGAARATRHLLHGDVGAAWADHPWLVLVALQAVLVGAWVIARRPRRRPRPSPNLLVGVAIANAVGLVGVWIVRLAQGSVPAPWTVSIGLG